MLWEAELGQSRFEKGSAVLWLFSLLGSWRFCCAPTLQLEELETTCRKETASRHGGLAGSIYMEAVRDQETQALRRVADESPEPWLCPQLPGIVYIPSSEWLAWPRRRMHGRCSAEQGPHSRSLLSTACCSSEMVARRPSKRK